MQQLRTILRLEQKRRSSDSSIRGLKHVGFRFVVGPTRTEELSAIPYRLDADHAVLPLLFRT